MRNQSGAAVWAGLVIALMVASAGASTTGITNYTQLTSPILYDVPANNALAVVNMGGVSVTPSFFFTSGAFSTFPIGNANNPGSGGGYSSGGALTLTFSQPVAGFGATFMHYAPDYPNTGQANPAKIELFGAANQLLGSVISSGALNGVATPDFVAVWSTAADVYKARLSGTTGSYAVDTYALTLTPDVPEAGMGAAVLIMTGWVGLGRRRWMRG